MPEPTIAITEAARVDAALGLRVRMERRCLVARHDELEAWWVREAEDAEASGRESDELSA